MPILDQEPQVSSQESMNFNVIIPKPFVLAEQSKNDLDKIRDEIMDKVTTWESRMSYFFNAYVVIGDSWKIKPTNTVRREARTLFNSKSGETHRATETMATLWFRMLTSADPNFDVVKRGLNTNGKEITEEELFLTMGVLIEQQKASEFKRKLLRSLRSTSLFALSIVEEPFISIPYGMANKYIEYTDWQFRSLIRTGFDTTTYDIADSDYIFFIDFPSKWMLRNRASLDNDLWDRNIVENHIKEHVNGLPATKNSTYSRIIQSRARAGYVDVNANVYENINYHGRLDTENSVIQSFAESINLENDPKYVDWSVTILDGIDLAKFHMTQYGDWRTRAKILTYKEFEDEPIPYGIGSTGRKLQREMDIVESLINDKAVFDILNMWKVGIYSGLDIKQFVAEPLRLIMLEDISQLAPLTGDPTVLRQTLELLGIRREEFRNIVGAQTNLQGQITGASATESALAQTEAMRGAGSQADILGDVLRKHLDTSHINNLNYMDNPIWISLTGIQKPVLVNKYKLPTNVGFVVKTTTDRDFRPEELKNIIQSLQAFSSIRNFFPAEVSINAIKQLSMELFRKLGKNPALLRSPVTQAEILETRMDRLMTAGRLKDELEGEKVSSGEISGTESLKETPIGLVPTSPISGLNRTDMSVV